jgi:glycosyltransferase involved in cell wall biosynthesis
MKILFLLGSPHISGGTNVILQHASYLQENGNEVSIASYYKDGEEIAAKWHSEARKISWKEIDQAQSEEYDIVIATWWKTTFDIAKFNAKYYCYFIQSIESYFYPNSDKPLVKLVQNTYHLPLYPITITKWICDYLQEKFDKEDIHYVRNGIRKDIYNLDGESIAPRAEGKLRVLVEGPVDVTFKNVPLTIELCCASKADEIWLLTSSKIDSYKGVDRIFSCVSVAETAKIYRSCDVIVKLSYVEGMYGPPLEMFHCGGTVITYDVRGHDEYIINDSNGIVLNRDDTQGVIHAINTLKDNQEYLNFLKKNAIQTAEKWPDWKNSSYQFAEALKEIASKEPVARINNIIQKLSMSAMEWYVIAEEYKNKDSKLVFWIKKFLLRLKNILLAKYPKIYNFLYNTHLAQKLKTLIRNM